MPLAASQQPFTTLDKSLACLARLVSTYKWEAVGEAMFLRRGSTEQGSLATSGAHVTLVCVCMRRGDVDDQLLSEAVAPLIESLVGVADVRAALSRRFNMTR